MKGLGGYGEAVITQGGVDTREVNPSTMESQKRIYIFTVQKHHLHALFIAYGNVRQGAPGCHRLCVLQIHLLI